MNVQLTAAQKKMPVGDDGIAAIMQTILKRENKMSRAQEHFWIVGLNAVNKILFVELLALGASNRLMINPPETFRMAIYKLAVKAVLVHNHPGGNIQPSKEDVRVTDHLTKAGEFLKIEVVDHIIISETEHFSFMTEGLMQQIKESPTWRLVKAETKEMEAMQKEMDAKRNKKEAAMQIAKKLKSRGVAIEDIKAATGLSLVAIHKL